MRMFWVFNFYKILSVKADSIFQTWEISIEHLRMANFRIIVIKTEKNSCSRFEKRVAWTEVEIKSQISLSE